MVASKQLGAALFTLSAVAVLLTQQQQCRRKSDNQIRVININDTVTVSCPGKVLIAGGYLVLERPNVGITIAGTSRFYTTVKFFSNKHQQRKPSHGDNGNVLQLVVYSPQFYEEYRFEYNFINEEINAAADSSSNTFVEKCLSMTMGFIKNYIGPNFVSILKSMANDGYLAVKLRADNDFYSQATQVRIVVQFELVYVSQFFSSKKQANHY
jgi:phosphomevalonate kinase